MTAYAPSDVAQTVVQPPQGCGQTHVRPVDEDGQPVQPWALDCPACQKFLTGPLGGWGGTPAEVPETHDETLQRENQERIAGRTQEQALGNLPENLAAALRGALGGGAGEIVRCDAGHPNLVSAKFCGECLIPMGSLTRDCPLGHENPSAAKFCGECAAPMTPASAATAPAPVPAAAEAPGKRKPLKDMRAEDLKALAASKGLSQSGTRAELIARIRAAA